MGECNLDKIEYAVSYDVDPQKISDEVYSCRRIAYRMAAISWRFEIPCTEGNGNSITSGNLEIEQIVKKSPIKRMAYRFLKYFEILGRIELARNDEG
jgi:hypothetical protein